MKTTSVDSQKVMVTAAIDFHTAILAIQEYAAKYPIERVSLEQADAVVKAGTLLATRKREWVAEEQRRYLIEVTKAEPPMHTCPVVRVPHTGCLHPERIKAYEEHTGSPTPAAQLRD